jgi:diguanylate cyclase (GGDEF)-like protein
MRHLTFRRKIILLAIAIVAIVQLATFVLVLDALRRDSETQANRAVALADAVLDEFMRNRNEQLLTTANVLVSDYAFRDAVAQGESPTIRSVLINHAARAGADVSMLLDLDGNIIASSLEDEAGSAVVPQVSAPEFEQTDLGTHGVLFVGDRAYQIVDVLVRSPLPSARVLLGFEIGAGLAMHVRSLTGLDVTFLSLGDSETRVVSSTLRDVPLEAALGQVPVFGPRSRGPGVAESDEYYTLLRPFLVGAQDMYAVLQLSKSQAMASYERIRLILIAVIASSLAVAVAGAFWVARMVTKPVDELAAAARRMREGVYTEIVEASSGDELGELAAGFNAMQAAIAERQKQILHIAYHDSLTELPNRQSILEGLKSLMSSHGKLAVIVFSITRFSRIVSSVGHHASDGLIRRVAQVLRGLVEGHHVLGHMNGHEFVLVLPAAEHAEAEALVVRIANVLHSGVEVDGANFSLHLNAGIASFPTDCEEPAGLLHRASIARAEAEARQELLVPYRRDQQDRALRQIRIIGDFPRAIENDELEVNFQPKIDCRTLDVCGAEALVRWRHPELGLLAPYDFVDAIEQAGSIAHLTRWVTRAAVEQCRQWRRQQIGIGISINISVEDLVDENLPFFLLELAREHGLKPSEITLEVTESAIMRNVFKAVSVISCIHELGFRLAIDDFGTGQSSLAQLRRLPVDELKIDKSFIMNLDDSRNEAIVHATIEMAHRLDLSICAEGIESLDVIAKLRGMGAEYGQGFAIAKPLAAAEFAEWYANWPHESAREPREPRELSSGTLS